MMAGVVSVEEVTGGAALTRFVELPQALHGTDPRFTPMVMAWERYRLDVRRNPFFERGEAVHLLARRAGRPAGRITAHLAGPGSEGNLGFWWSDDDPTVAAALVTAAQGWLADRGCASMTGPVSLTSEDELGVQVSGHDLAGRTGRPWHPAHLGDLLQGRGFEPVDDRPTWRLPATAGAASLPLDDQVPGHAGAFADPRLALEGVAAVPDVAGAQRKSGLRGAWALARRARMADWDTCTIVRCTDDPARRVPALQAAAARAGYHWVVAPWTPDPDSEPEAVHRTYRLRW